MSLERVAYEVSFAGWITVFVIDSQQSMLCDVVLSCRLHFRARRQGNPTKDTHWGVSYGSNFVTYDCNAVVVYNQARSNRHGLGYSIYCRDGLAILYANRAFGGACYGIDERDVWRDSSRRSCFQEQETRIICE